METKKFGFKKYLEDSFHQTFMKLDERNKKK
jgi:hypothetical protein